MKINDKAYVAIDYKLTVEGQVADESEEGSPLGFVCGIGQIVPGLEEALKDKEVGDEVSIDIKAEDGYGPHSKELLQELPKNQFPDDLEIEKGMVFQANTPHGLMRFIVDDVKDDVIVADMNHPLAGKDLHFDVKVVEVREATEAELTPPQSHCGDGSKGCGGCC